MWLLFLLFLFFFFNDTATTEIYTLSLHDALPISCRSGSSRRACPPPAAPPTPRDRKSTRLNSSHGYISYAVFCLKKKTTTDRASRAFARQQSDSSRRPRRACG